MNGGLGPGTRLTLCNRCAAAIQVPMQGGQSPCPACGAPIAIPARRDLRAWLHDPSRPSDPVQRLARLRTQPPVRLFYPREFGDWFAQKRIRRHVSVVYPQLDPTKEPRAFHAWIGLRSQVRGGAVQLESDFRLLTGLVVASLRRQGDLMRACAVLQSALEPTSTPQHQQALLATLAETAAQAGDLHAAQSWLALCDVEAEHVDGDSAYRRASAVLETVRGDWGAVLRTLGALPGDVPMSDGAEAAWSVLRANAHERTGDAARAVTLLLASLAKPAAGSGLFWPNPHHAALCAYVTMWGLCPETFVHAFAEHTRVTFDPGPWGTGRSRTLPILLLVLVLVMVLLGILTAAALAFADSPGTSLWLLVGIMGFVAAILGVLLVVSAISTLRWRGLTKDGIRGLAWIQDHTFTGTSIVGLSRVEFALTVQSPGQAPYRARTWALVHERVVMLLARGLCLPVRIARNDPRRVVFAID